MAYGEDNRARAKAWAAGIDAARRRAGFVLPDGLSIPADHLRRLLSQWALAELAPGRLLPWLPIAYGFGIVGYFTADHEPAWWAALTAALIAVTVATARIAHPVLGFSIWSAQVEGFVEVEEEREPSSA